MSILIKDTNIEDLQRAMLMFKGHEIIELPDHGDLIERQKVLETAHGLQCTWDPLFPVDSFDRIPVVIPAERSEE